MFDPSQSEFLLINLALVAEAVAGAVQKREETRGSHYRRDFERAR